MFRNTQSVIKAEVICDHGDNLVEDKKEQHHLLKSCNSQVHKVRKYMTVNKKAVIVALLVTLLISVAAGATLLTMRNNNSSDSNRNNNSDSNRNQECDSSGNRRLLSLPADKVFDIHHVERLRVLNDGDTSFQNYGCFQYQESLDSQFFINSNEIDYVQECSTHCSTFHFGITTDGSTTTCNCFLRVPLERLSIGSCDNVCNVAKEDRMEVYYNKGVTTECNQDATSAVRNFLVEEDDVPFGFDILTNEFRDSPFELYKDECGTNIYEVQTEISEGSNELTTTVQEVTEFAEQRRSSLSSSIKTSASASYKGLFTRASVKVSASLDKEKNEMLQSSGADSDGSRVYTSLGVKRIAEVKLVDFDNTNHFVTFHPQFGNLLNRYKRSGYHLDIAREIFNKYGMFVIERGIFGGFRQIRSTTNSADFNRLFASEEDSRQCFEAAASGKASGFGFSGSFSVEGGACSAEAASFMESQQTKYSSEVNDVTVTGGQVIDKELDAGKKFVVAPETSTLLVTPDKYPDGDDGIKLRLLSDFLDPVKVSPLEVKRYLLTESEFGDIQSHLEGHILEELQRTEAIMDKCLTCKVPYLQQTSDNSFQCKCYDPNPPIPKSYTFNKENPLVGLPVTFEGILETYFVRVPCPFVWFKLSLSGPHGVLNSHIAMFADSSPNKGNIFCKNGGDQSWWGGRVTNFSYSKSLCSAGQESVVIRIEKDEDHVAIYNGEDRLYIQTFSNGEDGRCPVASSQIRTQVWVSGQDLELSF